MSADEPPEIEKGSQVPTGARFVYHLAGERDVPQILTEGIDPTCHISDHSVEAEFLETVAREENVGEFPKSRQDCVFGYVERDAALRVANNLSSEVLLIVSISRVSAPMYASDCAVFSKFTRSGYDPQYSWSAAHDAYSAGNEEERAWGAVENARAYLETVTRVSSGTELAARAQSMRKPEVMIDGGVPPTAITAIYKGR